MNPRYFFLPLRVSLFIVASLAALTALFGQPMILHAVEASPTSAEEILAKLALQARPAPEEALLAILHLDGIPPAQQAQVQVDALLTTSVGQEAVSLQRLNRPDEFGLPAPRHGAAGALIVNLRLDDAVRTVQLDLSSIWRFYIAGKATVREQTPAATAPEAEIDAAADDGYPDLYLYKYKNDSGPPYAGGQASYSIYWYNGNGTARDVVLTDFLPISTTYVGGSHVVFYPEYQQNPFAVTVQDGQVSWQMGVLPPFSRGSMYVITALAPTLASGTVLTNTAVIDSSNDPAPFNNRASTVAQMALPAPDMEISKWVNGQLTPASQVVYNVYWRNRGNQPATNVIVTDTLPMGMTYVSQDGYAYTPAYTSNIVTPMVTGNVVTWNLGTVEPGWSGAFQVTLAIAPTIATGTVVTNTAESRPSSGEAYLLNNRAWITNTVVAPSPELYISKALASEQAIYPGAETRYQLYISNSGSLAADNVTITDTLPMSMSYVSYSGSIYDPEYTPISVEPTINGNVISWNIGRLSPGGAAYIYPTVRLAAGVAPSTSLTNRAAVSIAPGETRASDNQTQLSNVVLTPTPDMSIYKEGDTAYQGSDVTYRIYWGNTGAATATDVIVTDTLPAALTVVGIAGYGYTPEYTTTIPTATLDGRRIAWHLGDVEPGWSGEFAVTTRLPVTLATGAILTNSVAVNLVANEEYSANNVYTDTRTVLIPTPNLSLSKYLPGSLPSGAEVTYQLSYNNNSSSPAPQTILTDTLPAGMTFRRAEWQPSNSAALSTPITPTISGSTLTFTLGMIPSRYNTGYYGSVYITAYVADTVAVGTSLTNRAALTTPFETNPSDNSPAHTGAVVASARDLYVYTGRNSGAPVVGESYQYYIRLANFGNAAVTGVTLTNTLPVSTTFVSATDSNGNPLAPPTITTNVNGRQVLVWHIGTVPGSGVSGYDRYHYVTVALQPTALPGTALVNEVTAWGNELELPNNYQNYYSDFDTALAATRDLQVSKSFDNAQFVTPGSQVRFDLVAWNTGNTTAHNVVMTDTLPAGLTYDHISGLSGWSTSVIGNQLVFTRTTVPGSFYNYWSLYATVNETVATNTILTNTIVIGSADADDDPANNRATAAATADVVRRGLDLSKTLYEAADNYLPGTRVTWRLHYTNTGTVAETVMVTDVLPTGLTYDSTYSWSDTYGWTRQRTGNVVTWRRSSALPANETGYLYISGIIANNANPFSKLVNQATLAAVNNPALQATGAHTITVGGATINATPNPLDLGSSYPGFAKTQLLTVKNLGAAPLIIANITSTSPLLTVDPISLTLAAHSSTNISVTLTPTATGAFTGSLSFTSNDFLTPQYRVSVYSAVLLPPTIAVTPNTIAAFVDAGQITTATVTISNTGNSDLTFHLKGTPDLAETLANLNGRFQQVTDLIPNRYNFSDGESGTSISDGGNDMYDGGNYLYTNLGGTLAYSNDIIVENSYLGANGRYFTRKYPGLFVLAADMTEVDTFTIQGGLGADGGGAVNGAILQTTRGGTTYYGFVKRVYNAGDPSVNHLIIVANTPTADHTFATNTDNDYHHLFNLAGVTRLYYLLYAGSNGGYIDDTNTQAIMDAFLDTIGAGVSVPWLTVEPLDGTVAPATAQRLTLTLDATALVDGLYTVDLPIASNDPATPLFTLPIALSVGGEALARLDPPSLDLGDTYVGYSSTQLLRIHNDGTGLLTITDVSVNHPAVQVTPTTLTVPIGTSRVVSVTYAPTTVETLTATLTITTNQTLAPALTVLLAGEALAAPIIAVAPTAIEETLASGNVRDLPLTISNTGSSPLQWTIDISSTGTGGLLQPSNRTIGLVGWQSGSMSSRLAADSALSAYTFIDVGDNWTAATLQPYDLIVVAENDASITTTEAAALRSYAETGGPVILGMDDVDDMFPIEARNDLYAIFGVTNAQDGDFTFGALSGHPIAEGITTVGSVGSDNDYFQSAGAEWVVRDPAGRSFVFAYEGTSRTVLMGEDLNAWYDASPALVRNALLWAAESWLEVTPERGTVAPGSSATILLALDATNLMSGTYGARLYVSSNDPASPQVAIPVTLHVTGAPQLLATPNPLTFGTSHVNHAQTAQLTIRNTGADTLIVSSITTNNRALTVDPVTLTVAPFRSHEVTVTLAPTATGAFAGAVTLQSNDPAAPVTTVNVTAAVVEPPVIGVTPATFNVTQDTGLVVTRTLLIQNNGLGALDFALAVSNDIVTVAPLTGTVPPGAQQPITVTFDTTARANGFYSGQIHVNSNDPARAQVQIAVNLTVILAPPEVPVIPMPQNGEVNVLINTSLTWQRSPHATVYDLYFWPADGSKPASPTATLYQPWWTPPASLATNRTYRWQVIARNQVGSAPGAEWRFTTETLPDLTVTTVTAPPTAFSGQPLEVRWTVANNGNRGTTVSTWYDQVYLSTSPTFDSQTATNLGYASNPAFLNMGESYQKTATFNLPQGLSGNYYLFVLADGYNYMREIDETNNHGRSNTFQITLTPPPDLQVTTVAKPANAFSGDAVTIAWTVRNAGSGATPQSAWYDRIYLSADPTLEPATDFTLANIYHSGALAGSEAYTATSVVNIPQRIFGSYNLFVVTDVYDAVYENVFENNNTSAPGNPIAITLSPPPDLEVTSLTALTNLASGQQFTVNWEVANNGAGEPFEGYWLDRLYLSAAPTFTTTGAVVLDTIAHYGTLATDNSYVRAREVIIPNGLSGVYYLYLHTDYDNRVFEFTGDGNNVRRSAALQITLTPSPDLQVMTVTAPASGAAGAPLSVSWMVRNQGAATLATAWNDKVYLSLNSTWDGAGTLLGTFSRPAPLSAGATYSQSRIMVIPGAQIAGNYYLHVVTDADNAIYEHNTETNNSARSSRLTLTARPATDLLLSNLTSAVSGSSGQPISLTWTVRNVGSITTQASSWRDTAYLSRDAVLNTASDVAFGDWVHSGALAADATYSHSEYPTLPHGVSGEYYLFLVTDSQNNVDDNHRANNVLSVTTPISITLSPSPDLLPIAVNPPTTALAGQPLAVGWRVTNQGAAPATGLWYDAVYLSLNPTVDANDRRLVTLDRVNELAVNGSYNQSTTVTLPNDVSGQYYLLVVSDSRNDRYEHNAEGNNTAAWPIAVTVPPPADLIVTDVTVPANARPGAPVTIDWTLQNQGSFAANGSLCDAVFISADKQWDVNDALVGEDCRTINLAAQQRVARQLRVTLPNQKALAQMSAAAAPTGGLTGELPGVTPGQYYAIVRTDIRNNLPESDETNNAGASAETLLADVEALTLGTAVQGTLGAGKALYYRVEVPEGETLLISLDSASTAAANELYVRYGAAPSRGNFDFGFSEAIAADQEVVVPTTTPGTYYVMIYGASVPSGSQNFALTARVLDFELRNMDIREGGQGGAVTVKIKGAQFEPNTEVWLEKDGQQYAATQVFYEDASTLYATLDLSTTPLGAYDVVVRYKEDYVEITGTTFITVATGVEGITLELPVDPVVISNTFTVEDRLIGTFEVVPPAAQALEIRTIAPSAVRPNQPFIYTIEYVNNTNNDLSAPLLLIDADPNARMMLPSDDQFTFGPKRVMGLAQAGPSGVLRPGQGGILRIAVETPASGTVLNLDVDTIDEIKQPFDFSTLLAQIGIDRNSPAWAFAVAEVEGRLDGTWATYQRLLADYANSIWLFGVPTDADNLLVRLLAEIVLTQELEAQRMAAPQMLDRQANAAANNASFCSQFTQSDFVVYEGALTGLVLKWRLQGYTNAANLLSRYLGSGGDVDFPPGSQISRWAEADSEFPPIHQKAEGEAKNTIEQQLRSAGAAVSIADFSISGSLARPTFGSPPDMYYSINGTQGTTAEVQNIQTSEKACEGEGDGKTLSYKGKIRYQFMDNYEFTLADTIVSSDPKKSNFVKFGGSMAYILEQCGHATPFKTFTIVERSISGEIKIGECDDDDDDDDDGDDDGDDVPIVRPRDPNDIIGPAGFGDARWIADDSTLGYMIRFENDENIATAPAQRVTIEQTLDGDLDPRRFRLGAFGFGDYIFAVPENRSFYNARLGPLEIVSRTYYVDVTAGIDIITGKAFWILQTIDPATGAPPTDALAGFLPPDINNGEGQGFVTYSVRPKTTTATGALVDAQARILFDDQDPIDTPPIFNTIDADTPTSTMTALPAQTMSTDVVLGWNSSDAANGSGLAGVDLYVSTDGAPFAVWQTAVAETAAVFTGAPSHRYGFFALAKDNAGNREATKAAAETATFIYLPGVPYTTTLAATPPQLVANSSATSSVTATVVDAVNTPVAGTVVTFTATLGTVTPLTATTNGNGVATATFTAGTAPGTATIQGVAGDEVTGTVTVTLTVGPPAQLTVSAAPTTLVANGVSSSVLSATVVDAFANPVPGQVVRFTASTGTVAPLTTTTDLAGAVSATFTAGTDSGPATVTAATGTISRTTSITLTAGVPTTITVVAATPSLTANGASTTTLATTVVDAFANPVPGQMVNWTATLGAITPVSAVTAADGTATATFMAGTTPGRATIMATTGPVSATTNLTLTAGQPARISVMLAPTTLPADSSSTAVLSATVVDAFTNPVPGVTVSLTTTLGTVSPLAGLTTAGGVMTATFTAGATPGVATITAASGPISGTAVFTLTAWAPSLSLKTGWNLIALPLMPSDPVPAAVLAPINGQYDLVYAYTACSANPWQKYNPAGPSFANTLTTVTAAQGLWVRNTADVLLPVTGSNPRPVTLTLCAGWNLISYPAATPTPITAALAAISNKYDLVYAYDASNSATPWRKYNPSGPAFANTLTEMRSGVGYWIRVTEATTLVIP